MLKSLRVLVVDDDAAIVDVLTAFLSSKGFKVTGCGSATSGLEALKEEDYDLVLSDIMMAGMDGFEFLRLVRERHPEIGIILMTAYDETYPMSEALRAGADGYITKPFNLQKFSLIFEQAYWSALSRLDWWESHSVSA